MKTILLPILVMLGCALQDRSIGEEIENMSPSAGSDADDGASGNMVGVESSTGGEPAGVRVGAVLGSDGLCPFQFDKAFALTLQFTPGSEVCSAYLRDDLVAAGDAPTWYVWLGVPLAEPGVYDFAADEDDDVAEVIEASEGGGAAGGGHSTGSLEIIRVDATGVTGVLHDVDFGVGDVLIDLSGPFTATWCSEAEWLDIDFDPLNEPPEGFDPACKIPGA